MCRVSSYCGTRRASKRMWSEVEDLASYSSALPVIAELLQGIASGNEVAGVQVSEGAHEFEGSAINAQDFLIRLCKHGQCTKESFIVMTMLLDRLISNDNLKMTPTNLHKLMLAAFVVAVKTIDDRHLSNKYYASISGVSTATLNTLEASFLSLSQWDVYASKEDYDLYATNLSAKA
eukprot:Rhum_TRINITY_DN14186_c19_g1::Rhum_TRINITY_DN14186_c19_g1_i1::g.73063::m.73063